MSIYKKPYAERLTGASGARPRYVYSSDFLKSDSIFPLIVFDGGAYFMIKELMGERDPYSRDFFEYVASGEFFKNWYVNGKLDWNCTYKSYKKSALPINGERHVFINRLYFMLPLAQEFLLTKDEKWAEEWFKWLVDWADAHPYEPLDERPRSKTDYVWRDMQVTWRLLVLLYSIKMIEDSTYLTEERWAVIYGHLRTHAAHMYEEGLTHISARRTHNHYLQIGLVLLMTGVLFPELDDATKYEEAGRSIIKMNMEDALYADGGSVEGCPSYSHFIARMYLEAALLLNNNGLPTIDGLDECIKKQYAWLRHMMTPTGKTLQIGDSYALNAQRDLAIVSALYDMDLPKGRENIVLPTSRFAALHNRTFDVYIDAMDRTEGHQHFGRPHFVAFADGAPLVVDSGCCVYDRKDLRAFQMSAAWHNTVVIASAETGEILSDAKGIMIRVVDSGLADSGSDAAEPWILFETKSDAFVWTRKISLCGTELVVADNVNAAQPVVCTVSAHFAPTVAGVLSADSGAVSQLMRDVRVTVTGGGKLDMQTRPAMSDENGFFYSTAFIKKDEGTAVEFETRVACGERL